MTMCKQHLSFSTVALTLALTGCGGSSDNTTASADNNTVTDGTTNTDGSTSDTGSADSTTAGEIKTVQATVTTSNAQDLGLAAARGIKKAIIDKESNPQRAKSNPGVGASGVQLFSYPVLMASGIETIDVSVETCEMGQASVTFDDDFLSFSMDFTECYFEGATMEGYLAFSYTTEDYLEGVFEMDFSEYYDDGEYYSYQARGAELWSEDYDEVVTYYEYMVVTDWTGETWTLYDNLEICTGMNSYEPVCTFEDTWEEEGEAYRIEEAAVVGDDQSGFDVEAKIYDDENGFIEIDTTASVTANCSNKKLGSGSALFEGAEGSTGQITFDSCDSFTVTVDGVAQTYRWGE